MSGRAVFFVIISLMARFSEVMYLARNVFWFSTELRAETFLMSCRIQGAVIISVVRYSCKVRDILVQLQPKLNFLDGF